MENTTTAAAAHPTPANRVPGSENHESTSSLSERVSAAQARLAERTAPARAKAGEKASSAASMTKQFVTEHPIAAVSGALAAGALIALALPGRPGRKVRGSVMATSGLIAELAATYGRQLMEMAEDAAEASQEKLEEIGTSFAAATTALTGTAAAAGESAYGTVSRAGETAAKSVARAADAARLQSEELASRLHR